MPEETHISRVLPDCWQRQHWQDRLGIDLQGGCYEELCGLVLKQIGRLLRDDKWSATERWMLETLRDSEDPPPEWVQRVRAEAACS